MCIRDSSGIDLKELCRYAVMRPVSEQVQREGAANWTDWVGSGVTEQKGGQDAAEDEEAAGGDVVTGVRSVRQGDFMAALSVVQPAGRDSQYELPDVRRRRATEVRVRGRKQLM